MASSLIPRHALIVFILQIVLLKLGSGDQINENDYEPDYWRDKNDACPYESMSQGTPGTQDNPHMNGGPTQSLATAVSQVTQGNNFQCYCSNGGQQQRQPNQQQCQQQQQWQNQQQPQQQWQNQQPQPAPSPSIVPVPIPVPIPSNQNYNNNNGNNNNNNNGHDCDYCIRDHCNPAGCTDAKNFNALRDAAALQKAVKGIGTDEKTLIDILTHRSDDQIEEIRQEYVRCGRTIGADIEGDTSFSTKDLLKALVLPRSQFYAEEIEHAFKKGDSDTLIEIFCSLSDCALREVSSEYEKHFKKSLPESIKKATNLDFEKFLLELAKGDRDKNQEVDEAAAKKDATALINAGVNKWFGTDEVTFIKIFAHRSWPQLKEILRQYDLQRPKGILEDIKSETSGKLEKGLKTLIKNIRNQPGYFADELEKSLQTVLMPKPGDNRKLIRIMRGRCGVDLGDINEAYRKGHNNKQLSSRLAGKTYMDYETALLAMLKPQSR